MNLIYTIILTIIILVLIISIKDLFFEDKIKKINKSIPSPPTIPIFGNLLQINSKDVATCFNDFYKQYGKVYRLRLGSVETVVLTGGDIIDECFNKKYRDFLKARYVKFSRYLGKDTNILHSNGDYHFLLKGVLSSQVTVRKLNNGRLEFNKYILQMFNNLNNNDEGSTMFLANDVPSQIKKLILKVVLNFTLGIEENDDINLSLFQNGSNIFKAAGLFIYSDYLPFLFPLDIKSMAKSNMISSYVFVRDYLAKKLEEVKKKEYIINGDDDGGVDTSQTPLIESYYKLYLQGLIGYDSILLSIVDIIIASVDTTSNSISFIIARLTNHQEIQSKIYEEIMSNDINNNSNNISFSDHSKYPYIISIMNETYRYYASVPLPEPNMTTEDIEVDGYKIAKGTQIYKNIRGTLISKEFWGEDALEFKPERFKTQTLNQKGLLHFGAGPRGCPGARFTECFFFTLMVLLFKNYKLQNPNDNPIDDRGDVGLSMQCKPYDALFIKRN
ncbi:cytochrome P450 family protein [Dictyostelium discoideum AX4]|uniref:Probable cytochrome P450 514A2 n=1 Tax=Dictyostelium discoideum TaxID=44689 RepID=C5142_DICDI|nr:cytochrome P450 family protein [Dictyostelium discoideum AX4]Q1ZXC4.1 RecName: Full=Probable cytochrome P450 514A2 [Dictyostelium discoideum]EAS66829.1 cytochrome P450 family protein [Dictyostelium discoideum AX4]|eukprot:XP_001134512.1 cytochrome P450 family protein [Dictyostelium discoideum AX4]